MKNEQMNSELPIAAIKDVVKSLEKVKSDTSFVKVSLTLQSYKSPKGYLYRNERKLLDELLFHASVVILSADKISAAVILNSEMDHINCSLCQLLKKHPTTKTAAKTIKPLRIGRTAPLLMMNYIIIQNPLSC